MTNFFFCRAGSNRVQSGGSTGDSEVPSDQTLSDILDEVIDNMPDGDRPQPDVNVRQRQVHIKLLNDFTDGFWLLF